MTIPHTPLSAARPAILYVEDDDRLRKIVASFLRGNFPGADLHPAGSISEALQIVSGLGTPLSAVVSDGYFTKSFDENQTAVQLQARLVDAHPSTATVPFLVLTGNPENFPPSKFRSPPLAVVRKGINCHTTIAQELRKHLLPNATQLSA